MLIVFVAFLAACSPSKVAGPTTTSSTPRSNSTTSSTVASVPSCSTAVLQLGEQAGGASAGSSVDIFSVVNGGPQPCQLDGYPTLSFYGPAPGGGAGAGPALSLGEQHGGSAPSPVVLDAGRKAEFLVLFSQVPVDGAGCTTVASVRVRPSASPETISAPVSFNPCGPSVQVFAFAPPGSESP